jgi:hypothetical protein
VCRGAACSTADDLARDCFKALAAEIEKQLSEIATTKEAAERGAVEGRDGHQDFDFNIFTGCLLRL